MSTATLARLADGGDADARSLLATYVDHLAIGLASLVQTLDAERVILHGDVVGGGEAVESALRQAVERRTRRRPDVRFSELVDAALLGAAANVLNERFHRAEL